jgi:hypothetical protein
VLDVTSPHFDQLHFKLEGDNAMLPNLDLVNVAAFTSRWCVPTMQLRQCSGNHSTAQWRLLTVETATVGFSEGSTEICFH